MTIKTNRIERYYDTHEVEGAELTQSVDHYLIIEYLIAVLKWLFNGKKIGMVSNVNFYKTANPLEAPISPDIAVVDGLPQERKPEDKSSYYVGENSPPPKVIFEIASKETWRKDLEEKPALYQTIGVNEYFVYDPNELTVWTKQWRRQNRLIGWRMNPLLGQYEPLEKDEAGRLWSEELASWLVIEPEGLRLYTADGQLRFTEAEAERQNAAMERQNAQAERLRAEAALQEAATKDSIAEMERQRAEAALKQNEELKEKLRKLGLDPDDLA